MFSGGASLNSQQQVARATRADGISNVALDALAGLGCSGQLQGNGAKDMNSWLFELYGVRLQPQVSQSTFELLTNRTWIGMHLD